MKLMRHCLLQLASRVEIPAPAHFDKDTATHLDLEENFCISAPIDDFRGQLEVITRAHELWSAWVSTQQYAWSNVEVPKGVVVEPHFEFIMQTCTLISKSFTGQPFEARQLATQSVQSLVSHAKSLHRQIIEWPNYKAKQKR